MSKKPKTISVKTNWGKPKELNKFYIIVNKYTDSDKEYFTVQNEKGNSLCREWSHCSNGYLYRWKENYFDGCYRIQCKDMNEAVALIHEYNEKLPFAISYKIFFPIHEN